MKKTFSFFTLIFLFCAFLTITACKSNNTNEQETQKSAIYTLSSDEKIVYNSVKGSISAFKDPSSVRVVTVYEKAFIGRYIRISAKNSFGGTVTNIYFINGHSLESTTDVDIYSYDIDPEISVSKINAALDEYKEQKGWI